jgi:hypothetical protein
MNLDSIAEVWDVLRSHIDFSERKDAAETLVGFLIENNCEADEIKQAFRGDKEVAKALLIYDDSNLHEEEDDYDDDYDDEDRY